MRKDADRSYYRDRGKTDFNSNPSCKIGRLNDPPVRTGPAKKANKSADARYYAAQQPAVAAPPPPVQAPAPKPAEKPSAAGIPIMPPKREKSEKTPKAVSIIAGKEPKPTEPNSMFNGPLAYQPSAAEASGKIESTGVPIITPAKESTFDNE